MHYLLSKFAYTRIQTFKNRAFAYLFLILVIKNNIREFTLFCFYPSNFPINWFTD